VARPRDLLRGSPAHQEDAFHLVGPCGDSFTGAASGTRWGHTIRGSQLPLSDHPMTRSTPCPDMERAEDF